MQLQGQATRVTLYIGESDHYDGRSLYMVILEFLRKEGAAGTTVTRGLAGFGAHSRIHTATVETLSVDLPMRLEWIDLPERVARLLPAVRRMVNDGLIIVEQVNVVQYSVGRSQEPLEQPVHNIMREEIVTVQPDTPVAQVMTLLLERGVRSLPVVDEQHRLVGILTAGDLLRRANLSIHPALHSDLPAQQLQSDLAALRQSTATAAAIMTPTVITVRAVETVRRAVERMVQHNLKRLPVVDAEGRLVGVVSRIDIFRTVEYHQAVNSLDENAVPTGHTIAELIYRETPTVPPDASLETVLQALEQNGRRRVVVIDADQHVVGIITDGDLLRRSQQREQPSLISRLRHLLTGHQTEVAVLPNVDERAADLMTTPVITIGMDSPLGEALRLMTQHAIKRLPVVDGAARLVGLLDRASVLRGLLADATETGELA